MTPEEHPVKLAWHLAGTLPPEESASVEEHLARCEECRVVRDSLLVMQEALLAEFQESHVPPEELVAFVESTLPPRRETIVRRHLAACAECRDDRERLEETTTLPAAPHTDGTAPRSSGRQGLRRGAILGAAAAAVLVLLSAVIIRTLRPQGPPLEAIQSVTLLPAVRGSAPEAALDGRGPWVATVVLPSGAPAGQYHVEIRTGAGDMVGDKILTRPAAGQEIPVLIRTLPVPGEYAVIVRPAQPTPGTPYRYSFRLE